METFKIFGNEISFDEDISKYSAIYMKTFEEIEKFSNTYKSQQHQIKNMNEFYDYAQSIQKLVRDECVKRAEMVINIFIDYKIYDKSVEDIGWHAKSLNDFYKYIDNVARQISAYLKNLDNHYEDFRLQATLDAQEAIEPYYIGMISSSSWDIITTDIINDIEEARVKRKRQNMVDSAMYKKGQELLKASNKFVIDAQLDVQEQAYKFGVLAIKEIFDYCVDFLISENKISNTVLNNLQKEKSEKILSNLERIQNEDERKNQLIVALQAYPYNSNIYSKIMEYDISSDIDDFSRLVDLFSMSPYIFKLCMDKISNNQNIEMYFKLIKLLDQYNGNNYYLGMYLDTTNTNYDKKENIQNLLLKTKHQFEILNKIWENNSVIKNKESEIENSLLTENLKNNNIILPCEINNEEENYLNLIKEIDEKNGNNTFLNMYINTIKLGSFLKPEKLPLLPTNVQHIFEMLYKIWPNNSIIAEKEKQLLKDIVIETEKRCILKYDGDITNISYEDLKNYTKNGYQQSLINKQKQWHTYKPFLIVIGISLIVIILGLLFS